MAWCLVKSESQKFKEGLKDGSIDPIKLSAMSSVERRAFIEKFISKENAQQVNSLFESKLLLKNKKAGYITWAKRVSGMTKEAKRDLISKIERMDRILDPKEEEQFLQDLASTRLKINITQEEAQKISELSKKITELKSKTDVTKPDILLGRAKLDLTDYVNELGGRKADLLTNIAGVPRTVMTSIDLSAPLNQGWGMVSRKRFYTSFGSMFKYAVSKNAFRDLQASIITNPYHDVATKAGLRLTELGEKLELREEQFMSSLLDKFPGVAQSQRAYTGFLNKLRMDSFVDFIKKAEVAGEDVSIGSQASKDIASMVNNFTGGARVGKIEQAVPLLNATFFSPRKIASTVNILNPVNYVNPKISPTARKEATRNLIGSLSLSAGAIALYSMLTGEKQETDPTSTDFGKIRSGKTRLDVSGGNANYLTMLARIITQRIKGSSGVTRKLGTGYGETSGWDLLTQFLRYKLSPNASFLIDAVTGANAIGEKKTVAQSAIDRIKPMFASSVVELLKSDTENKFAFALASLFGAGLNTYSQITDWSESTSKELLQFKSKVGEKTFGEANDLFNKRYDEWITKTSATEEFKNLSEDGKEKLIKSAKDKFKQEVFDKYEFKYEKEQTPDEEKDIIESLKPQLQSAVQKINEMLVGDVLASDNGDRITRVDLEGDQIVTTIISPDGKVRYKLDSVNDDLSIKEWIGKKVAELGEKYKIPEMKISEKIGWNPEEHKKQLIEEKKSQIARGGVKAGGETLPVETPKPENKPSREYFANSTDANGNEIQVKVPDEVAKAIEDTFGDKAQEAIDILHHPYKKQKKGVGRGENAEFKVIVDASNEGYDKPLPNKDYVGDVKGKDGMWHSVDRGLFRINSRTFQTYLFGKEERSIMYKVGIIDDPIKDGNVSKEEVQKYWDGMNDLDKNVKMAKIIFDKQGTGAWFASLAD